MDMPEGWGRETGLTAQDIVPFLTIPGSIIGIITGAFVLWERIFRYEPSAYLIAKPMIPGGVHKAVYARIINRSDRPIVLSWPNGRTDSVMRIAIDHSARAIVGSVFEGTESVVLDGQEEKNFPVMLPPNWQDLEQGATIEIVITWRFVQPLLWKRDRYFTIRVDKRSYQLLVGDDD